MRTVTIPGGHATLRSKRAEVTPRRMREVEFAAQLVGPTLQQLQGKARILCEGRVITDLSEVKDDNGDPKYDGDVEVTRDEAHALREMNDALAWALLDSWTLDIPLPKSPDAFVDDCPLDVYYKLMEVVADIERDLGEAGFTVDSVEDPASPTGPSGE